MLGKFIYLASYQILDCIYYSAWDEIYDVFGDGHDYDWALVEEEELGLEEDVPKGEMRYQDVSCLFLRMWQT